MERMAQLLLFYRKTFCLFLQDRRFARKLPEVPYRLHSCRDKRTLVAGSRSFLKSGWHRGPDFPIGCRHRRMLHFLLRFLCSASLPLRLDHHQTPRKSLCPDAYTLPPDTMAPQIRRHGHKIQNQWDCPGHAQNHSQSVPQSLPDFYRAHSLSGCRTAFQGLLYRKPLPSGNHA